MIQSLRNQLERSGNVPAMSRWMGIKVTVLNCIKRGGRRHSRRPHTHWGGWPPGTGARSADQRGGTNAQANP